MLKKKIKVIIELIGYKQRLTQVRGQWALERVWDADSWQLNSGNITKDALLTLNIYATCVDKIIEGTRRKEGSIVHGMFLIRVVN